jgi:predicted alpha-1,2-mannosidase
LYNKRKDGKDNLLRSMNFINVFDPKTKFMRARKEGMWYSPFDPSEVNFNYTEANSWQYSLYAPHAVGVMRDLLGGKDSLSTWLDRLFTTNLSLTGRNQADITGLIGQYDHGNEPSHHIAYLYAFSDTPKTGQKYIHKIMNEFHDNTPNGMIGNDDCGQMSAWYILSTLGFYPVNPTNGEFVIGAPQVKKATLRISNNKQFTITAEGFSNQTIFQNNSKLNGIPLEKPILNYADIMKGGTLNFKMTTN